MKFLLRQLPIFEAETTAAAPDMAVTVRAYQIVAWVSLGVREVLEPDAPRFPAVIDPGTNHNFLIQEDHLERWGNLSLSSLPRLGQVYLGDQELPLVRVSAWIYPIERGSGMRLPNDRRSGWKCRRGPSSRCGVRRRRPGFHSSACGLWSATGCTWPSTVQNSACPCGRLASRFLSRVTAARIAA